MWRVGEASLASVLCPIILEMMAEHYLEIRRRFDADLEDGAEAVPGPLSCRIFDNKILGKLRCMRRSSDGVGGGR